MIFFQKKLKNSWPYVKHTLKAEFFIHMTKRPHGFSAGFTDVKSALL